MVLRHWLLVTRSGVVMGPKPKMIAVENINVPGSITNVNAVKYEAMKTAFLFILPDSSPGLTQKEIQEQVKPHLPQDTFPQGKTSAWWAKTVQLDLEAKKVVVRENCKPLRLHKS